MALGQLQLKAMLRRRYNDASGLAARPGRVVRSRPIPEEKKEVWIAIARNKHNITWRHNTRGAATLKAGRKSRSEQMPIIARMPARNGRRHQPGVALRLHSPTIEDNSEQLRTKLQKSRKIRNAAARPLIVCMPQSCTFLCSCLTGHTKAHSRDDCQHRS